MRKYILNNIVPEGRQLFHIFGESEPTSNELRVVLNVDMEIEEPELSKAVEELLTFGSYIIDANWEVELDTIT